MSGDHVHWGWHRLGSTWAHKLVNRAGIEPGDLVVDIGAGTGAITRALVAAGAKVVAVELHPRRAAQLRREFARQAVIVVRADAADLRLPRRPFHVVANPPFAITTAVIRRLTHAGSQLEHADLVVPSWAAMRWTAGRGLGGAGARHDFEFTLGQRIPTQAFRPPSPTPARVLRITRRAP